MFYIVFGPAVPLFAAARHGHCELSLAAHIGAVFWFFVSLS